MTTSKYIKVIYECACLELGKVKARNYVAVTMTNIIFDLEEAGHFTPESLEMALKEEAEFCQRAAKKDVA